VRRLHELSGCSKALYKEFTIDCQLEEEIINAIVDPMDRRLWKFIHNTPPIGPTGAAVKLRLLLDDDVGWPNGPDRGRR
jgi:hypothetical protein